MAQNAGAARSRLASRESFFGGPLSTREQSKAPGWSAFAKAAPPAAEKEKPTRGGGKGGSGGGKARQLPAKARQQQQQQQSAADAERERLAKIRARRDFSGLGGDEAPPPPPKLAAAAGSRQQTAAGPPQWQRNGDSGSRGAQQRQRAAGHQSSHTAAGGNKVTVKKAAAAGGGRMAVAARGMAVEVATVGKGRKQLASEALKQRVGEMIAGHNPGGGRPGSGGGRAADLGSPTGSGTAGGAAAAAAARAAREAAAAKPVMQRQVVKTATGMQTMQLVKRPPGQAGGPGQRPGAAAAAAGAAGSSPGSVTKGQRPGGSAAAAARRQLSPADRAAAAAGRGRPQFRGAFYGGRQPPAALEARMQYNKRRLSLDSGGSLGSFIASDDELEGEFLSDGEEGGQEGDWRAALREATGGYDPSKFAHIDRLGDRDMEAGYNQIEAEERRALRIARAEDEREAEAEARREAAKRERKRTKRSGAAAFLDMD